MIIAAKVFDQWVRQLETTQSSHLSGRPIARHNCACHKRASLGIEIGYKWKIRYFTTCVNYLKEIVHLEYIVASTVELKWVDKSGSESATNNLSLPFASEILI